MVTKLVTATDEVDNLLTETKKSEEAVTTERTSM